MSEFLIRHAVRGWFLVTSRKQASGWIEKALADYLSIAKKLEGESGKEPVHVPRMPGVDPEMQDWSFYMLLEHNVIVNRSIAAIVEHLANGLPLKEAGQINPKTDVLPTAQADVSQVDAFTQSVEDYLLMASKLKRLRGTRIQKHPVFGDFDAHGWHCMFGFHLRIHLKQARLISEGVTKPCGCC